MSGITGKNKAHTYLFTPGPVPVDTETALSGARPMISHRGEGFHELFSGIQRKFGELLKSAGPVVIFPSSGTGALEALASNLTGPDTRVMSVSCGVFGDRFREIASRFGSDMINIDIPQGEGVSPEAVSEGLARNPGVDVLLLTHNETSTGVLNPVKEIIASIPEWGRPLVLVDGVSSVGAMPCYPEKWGVDGLAFASQKGLLTPPGLGLVWLSERAWEKIAGRKSPSYYFDLKTQRKHLGENMEKPENPYTPPVSLYFAISAALDRILSDELHFAKRERAARALASGIEALGFEPLVSNKKFRSPGVTAFSLPGGNVAEVAKKLRSMGVEPAGGQGALKGKIMRIAHYHDFDWPEISLVLGSLYASMGEKRRGAGDFMRQAHDIFSAFPTSTRSDCR